MNSTFSPHPDNDTLLRLLDDDLSRTERQLVDGHLGGCRACQRELEEVREALNDYLRFHQVVLKAALPPAPRPWDRLDQLAARMPGHAPRTEARLFTLTARRWLAAAAAIAAIFVLARRLERAPEVKAAELLHKATAAEQTAPARARSIRMKSHKYKWDRPARLPKNSGATSADADGIRRLLESAGYSWEDPLSVEAYVHWHDRLPEKRDRVEDLSQSYVIHTTTPAGPISDASLTLRAADLHAVACTLRFGAAETVEMTESQDEEPAPPASEVHTPPPAIRQPPPAPPSPLAGPGEELAVIAALHRIGADLGEPIDVRREGTDVLVNVTGLDTRRQGEVKAALSGLAAVRLQFGEIAHRQSQEAGRRPKPQVDATNPLLSELQAARPDGVTTADLSDQLTDSTENIIERAYALRGLARRFPTEATAQMTADGMATLRAIVRDHARAIATSTAAIERLMKPILPQVGPAIPNTEDPWQAIAQATLTDVQDLDEALNAGSTADAAGGRKLRAAQALANVDRRLTLLGAPVQP